MSECEILELRGPWFRHPDGRWVGWSSLPESEKQRLSKTPSKLTHALDKLLDSLPPDFPNRAYYDEITAEYGLRDSPHGGSDHEEGR